MFSESLKANNWPLKANAGNFESWLCLLIIWGSIALLLNLPYLRAQKSTKIYLAVCNDSLYSTIHIQLSVHYLYSTISFSSLT